MKYLNIHLMGLKTQSHTTGHGMSDDFVSAEKLEKVLQEADSIEINGNTWLLVAPITAREPIAVQTLD